MLGLDDGRRNSPTEVNGTRKLQDEINVLTKKNNGEGAYTF
jgi:hypothetical protein